MTDRRRIFAFSGVLRPEPGGPPTARLIDFALSLAAGPELAEAVTILPGKHAWHVAPDGAGGYTERRIVPRLIR